MAKSMEPRQLQAGELCCFSSVCSAVICREAGTRLQGLADGFRDGVAPSWVGMLCANAGAEAGLVIAIIGGGWRMHCWMHARMRRAAGQLRSGRPGKHGRGPGGDSPGGMLAEAEWRKRCTWHRCLARHIPAEGGQRPAGAAWGGALLPPRRTCGLRRWRQPRRQLPGWLCRHGRTTVQPSSSKTPLCLSLHPQVAKEST